MNASGDGGPQRVADAAGHRLARLATAGSALVLASASAAQMLLFLGEFGTSATTDGVLGAYSLYVLVTVFAQGSRISASAAIGGERPRMRSVDLAWGLAAVSVLLVVLATVLREPLSQLVASGEEARDAAADLLPVLGLGMAAQFAAVTWATIIAQRGRLTWGALSLAAGGIVGLAGFALLLPSQRENALGWATVISGATACGGMAIVALPRWHRPSPRAALSALGMLGRENLVPMFSTAVYVVSVGFCAQVTDEAGAVSLFALAFLACSYLCGILGTTTAIVDTVVLADARDELGARLRRIVLAGVRLPFFLAGAALALGALVGPPLVALVAPERVGTADPELLATCLLLLAPFTFATLATNVAFSCWFTSDAVLRLNRGLLFALPLHVAATALLGLALGVTGVALAAGVSTVAFGVYALRPAAGLGRIVAGLAVAAAALAAVSFGPAAALAQLVDDELVRGLVAAGVGSAAFAVALRAAAPRLASAIRP
ncbi:MAG: hypothetical protein Q7T55_02655 [Solirubrobacteraceae bacterium]|nr:hypothetical protein [Solirubrobacteraceae bacterium]